ncbi:hypothetical protein DFH07DRAFT_221172 [Mycena maculata]|uniref:Uncharacterized protein n=1 Tax=Mycena maculata TaxID=230809 RepID=A0AAD7MSC9_9AGAR|nr:hypothetical protein DFH07DRAFT_221172 [Mycena maculata]
MRNNATQPSSPPSVLNPRPFRSTSPRTVTQESAMYGRGISRFADECPPNHPARPHSRPRLGGLTYSAPTADIYPPMPTPSLDALEGKCHLRPSGTRGRMTFVRIASQTHLTLRAPFRSAHVRVALRRFGFRECPPTCVRDGRRGLCSRCKRRVGAQMVITFTFLLRSFHVRRLRGESRVRRCGGYGVSNVDVGMDVAVSPADEEEGKRSGRVGRKKDGRAAWVVAAIAGISTTGDSVPGSARYTTSNPTPPSIVRRELHQDVPAAS